MSDLKLALELAENFRDGTDYRFDRLTPDEQHTIVDAARAHLDCLRTALLAEEPK